MPLVQRIADQRARVQNELDKLNQLERMRAASMECKTFMRAFVNYDRVTIIERND